VLESLQEACENQCVMTNSKMVQALIKRGVITTGGNSRWMTSGQKGENYDLFVSLLRAKLQSMGSDQ
jgi:hypothetical protein